MILKTAVFVEWTRINVLYDQHRCQESSPLLKLLTRYAKSATFDQSIAIWQKLHDIGTFVSLEG